MRLSLQGLKNILLIVCNEIKKKKKKWTDYLSEEVYVRLCECRTIKADIPELVESKWKTMEYPYTKEDALIWIIDLVYMNDCFIELTTEEWDELIKE